MKEVFCVGRVFCAVPVPIVSGQRNVGHRKYVSAGWIVVGVPKEFVFIQMKIKQGYYIE